MPGIAPIVEGHSEVHSVPVLLRRILYEMQVLDVQILRPFRIPRYKVVKKGQLERTMRQAINGRSGADALLVIIDSDDDCPARLAQMLLERARHTLPDYPVAVVLAHREFESWFLGAKESLRNVRGIRSDAVAPQNPEQIRDAKRCLTLNMQPRNRRYLEIDDQPAFAESMDLTAARERCPSFDKLFRKMEYLVCAIRNK